jgi:hypothetical protein
LMVVDGSHNVTILETSDNGQDVSILRENDTAPRARLGLRGNCMHEWCG